MNWPTFTQPSPNESYNFSPKLGDRRPVRILILIGLGFMAVFLGVYLQPASRGYPWLFALLTTSVAFKLVRLVHEWYHYWQVEPPVRPTLSKQTSWKVDVLTTFCPGEPYEMVINSLRAIQAIRYPHITYLCDEANDPYLREVCQQLGVRYVTRTGKTDAKAGNINNALRQADGDICLILDPDHVPVPDFLDQVLPYFEDPNIGFVQCVQGYYNRKESVVAYAAAEQTYTFYGPMMTCMGQYGTAQAIGANCTFRRAALDAIGGHAAGLSEDMHTAMQLHANGWTSVYVPLPLSYGLVPATLSAYYKQQLKWARGTFELLVTTYPRVFSGLSWRQRLHYLILPLYYLLGVVQLLDWLIPILSLVMMRLPLRLDLLVFATAYLPLLVTAFLIRQYAQRWLIEKHEAGFHLLGGVLSSGTWWVYLLGFVYTIFRFEVPYLPTPKDDKPRNNVALCLPNLLMILASLSAIGYSVYHYGRFAVSNVYSQLMIFFGLLNVVILALNVLIGQEKWLAGVKGWIETRSVKGRLVKPVRVTIWQIRYGLYGWLRLSAIPLFVGLLVLTTALVTYTHRKQTAGLPRAVQFATTQPFYYGLEPADSADHQLTRGAGQSIVPQHLTWSAEPQGKSLIASPNFNLSAALRQLPLLYLEPAMAGTSDNRSFSEAELRNFLQRIRQGQYDTTLLAFFHEVKRYHQPVLLSFAPQFDDTTHAWGTQQEPLLTLYRQTWQYLVRYCQQQRVDNVTWVWCPARPSTIVSHYPGASYIDWIGLEVINNPALAADGQSHSFAALFQQVHSTIRVHVTYSIRQKPILITRFGAVAWRQDDRKWLTDALDMIRERYPEIRGLMINPQQARLVRLNP